MRLYFTMLMGLIFISCYAQTNESTSPNMNFELGNFTNWEGYTWLYSTDVTSINTSKVKGIVYRRQTIMTDTTAYDANTGNALKKIPSGYRYSARLGDETTSADSNPRCWQQSLRYTLTVDSTNALLIMKFACVLQYADDHTATMEPRFRVTLFNQKGDTIPDCANYDVYASSTAVAGFKTYTPSGSQDPVQWRDWTTVGANLLDYVGQTITLEFMASDCTGRFHYGYAYFVAQTQPMYITVKYCAGDEVAELIAPEGFTTYIWKDPKGAVVGSTQTLDIANPNEGDTYSCQMVSATGCTVTLQATIARYTITPDFTSSMIDCKSNTVQITNLSTTTHGTLTYLWDLGDGGTSTEKSPKTTFASSGLHTVTLTLANPPSTCTSTLTKDVESFSPPLVGIEGDSTYCPNETTILTGKGAYQYTWSTGVTANSIEIGSPGASIWMLGHSSTGCVSDTMYMTVSEEPDWTLTLDGALGYCEGSSTELTASGAATYQWNTGATTPILQVTSAGNYTITAANARGCTKELSAKVTEYALPNASYSLSESTINTRHHTVTGTISPENSVTYDWNMGDGTALTGADIQHTYTINYDTLAYTVSLTALNMYGCSSSSTQTIDVIPFVPNVFSPNNDGVNDVFMAGLQLRVTDRNGLVMYNGSDGWDGTYNGQPADPDTYFYLIEYTDKNHQTQTLKGYITLVK